MSTKNTIYLVRQSFGLKKLDYGFGAEKDQHVPVAGQVGPNGEPLAASEARAMRDQLPVAWGTGSTFSLQCAGVRVAPGDVSILARYTYGEPAYGVYEIDGETLTWTVRTTLDHDYQAADGRRYRGLIDFLKERAGISG